MEQVVMPIGSRISIEELLKSCFCMKPQDFKLREFLHNNWVSSTRKGVKRNHTKKFK
ncbi:unnamed protein product [Dovyalis caffra]|uniref:Uncharacterized protein n=1 Tax=Dovyalis caffra TaxID=77055 RepID=A0AAV1R5Z3_9ROSI|nr:unnamed protein product [Dovyalis caffra]